MTLCLDVGNTNITGAIFLKDQIIFNFRKTTAVGITADEIGIFLYDVLIINQFEPKAIKNIGLSSVVPNLNYTLSHACRKYFNIEPFLLKAGIKTKLKIHYYNPNEVGADRIANAIGTFHLFPNEDAIIVDLGTATTFCAISKEKDYYGGAIMPGLNIAMQALEAKTARLPNVELIKPLHACGKSTIENIQSGLYYSHLGAIKILIDQFKKELFINKNPKIIGTGGLSALFNDEKIFDVIDANLTLKGIYYTLKMNEDKIGS